MSSSLKSITQQLDSFNGFHKFPVPGVGNNLEVNDERYNALEGAIAKVVYPELGTLTFKLHKGDGLYEDLSSIFAWVEDTDPVLHEALEKASYGDKHWEIYVNVDITCIPENNKTLASSLETGTLFLGKINGVTRSLFTTTKYTSHMICIPIGNSMGYDPKDVEVLEIFAENVSEEGIWL